MNSDDTKRDTPARVDKEEYNRLRNQASKHLKEALLILLLLPGLYMLILGFWEYAHEHIPTDTFLGMLHALVGMLTGACALGIVGMSAGRKLDKRWKLLTQASAELRKVEEARKSKPTDS